MGGTRSGWTPKHGHGLGELNKVLADGLQVGLLACHLRGPCLQPRVLADEVGEAGDSEGTEGTWVRRGRHPEGGMTHRDGQRDAQPCTRCWRILGLGGDAPVDSGVSVTLSMCVCVPMSHLLKSLTSHVSCSCVPMSPQMRPHPCPHTCPHVPTGCRWPTSRLPAPRAGSPGRSGASECLGTASGSRRSGCFLLGPRRCLSQERTHR